MVAQNSIPQNLFYRYHKEEDGCFRVQTVRFESEDLATADALNGEEEDDSNPSNSNPDDDLLSPHPSAIDEEEAEATSSSVAGSVSVRSEQFEDNNSRFTYL